MVSCSLSFGLVAQTTRLTSVKLSSTGLVPLTTRLTSVILSNFPANKFDDLSPLLLTDRLVGLSHFLDTRGISVAHWYRLILCIGLTPLTVNGFWYSRYNPFVVDKSKTYHINPFTVDKSETYHINPFAVDKSETYLFWLISPKLIISILLRLIS